MEILESWSKSIASLAVDIMIDAGFIKQEDFDEAVEVMSEEISTRLVMGDCPQANPESDSAISIKEIRRKKQAFIETN